MAYMLRCVLIFWLPLSSSGFDRKMESGPDSVEKTGSGPLVSQVPGVPGHYQSVDTQNRILCDQTSWKTQQ